MTKPWIVEGEFPVTGGVVAEGAPDWDIRTCANGSTLKVCRGCQNANACAKRGSCLRAERDGRK